MQGRKTDRCREQTCGRGSEGEGGIHWEIRIDVYPLPCVKWTASGKLLCSTGSSALCSVMTERAGMRGVGWKLKREGVYVYLHSSHAVE